MNKFLIFFLLTLLIIGFSTDFALAQCAMCKATIEANSANSNKYGVGLNTGILYLMSVPYIAASVLGFLWYKNAKAKKAMPKFR